MKKYNILHIITKLELGGAQQNTIDTVRYLSRDIYNPYLVAGISGVLVEEAKNIVDAKVVLLAELRHEINPFYDLMCLLKLIKLFKKEKIDIVHTHSSKAGILGRFAAKLAGVPVIIHSIHGFSFNKFQNFFIRGLYIFFERLAAKFTHKLIAVTTTDVKKGLDAGVGHRQIYTVIRSGIDLVKFRNTNIDVMAKKMELGLTNASWNVVGMIACFKPQKAPVDFIRMADIVSKKNPTTYFLLVGDGILRNNIEKLIKKLNIDNRVFLTGWRRDVNEIIKIFDVFVLTSLWEGLPRSILQAFAGKVPVVTTRVDGSAEVIEDGKNGLLVEPGDHLKMAEKVRILLEDKTIAKQIGEDGFNTLSEEFDYRKMINRIDSLYRELLHI